jgi:hypothetical protein
MLFIDVCIWNITAFIYPQQIGGKTRKFLWKYAIEINKEKTKT